MQNNRCKFRPLIRDICHQPDVAKIAVCASHLLAQFTSSANSHSISLSCIALQRCFTETKHYPYLLLPDPYTVDKPVCLFSGFSTTSYFHAASLDEQQRLCTLKHDDNPHCMYE